MPSGLRDHALQDAVEDEVLLHLVHALVEQAVALAAVDDVQVRLELVAVCAASCPCSTMFCPSCTRMTLRSGGSSSRVMRAAFGRRRGS